MKNISAYQQTKAVYTQYNKAKDKEKFLRGKESSIIIHEAAARTLQAAKKRREAARLQNAAYGVQGAYGEERQAVSRVREVEKESKAV